MQYELNIDPRYLAPDSEIGGLSWSAPRTLEKAISLTSGRSGIYRIYQNDLIKYDRNRKGHRITNIREFEEEPVGVHVGQPLTWQ